MKPLRVPALRTVPFRDDALETDGQEILDIAATARPSVSIDCIDDVGIQIIAEDGASVMAVLSFADAHKIARWISAHVPGA
jgi:hypothetical protein